MPRKKNSRKKTSSRTVKKKNSNFLSRIRLEESYTSLIIGVVVVLIVVGVSVFFLRTGRMSDTSSVQFKPSIETQETKTETEKKTSLPQTYVIKPGENLWVIAEKIYNSGYNWVDIAKANNLVDPGVIHSGNRLTIPNVQSKIIAVNQVQNTKPAGSAISADTYTVIKGDFLWEIAVRAYGDGYAWVKIAKANNLANPDVIYSGNVLKIPR